MKSIKQTELGLLKFEKVTAVTSKTVADALGIAHKNLMRNIIKTIKLHKSIGSHLSSLNCPFNPIFSDYRYIDTKGRTQTCKLMNEDAVKALIKVVNTQEAYNYFVLLMNDFKTIALERAARESMKEPTNSMHRALKILVDKLKESYPESSRGVKLYQHIHVKINKAVTGKGRGVDRDSLPESELKRIKYLEHEVSIIALSDLEPEETRQCIFSYLKKETA